MYSLKFIYNDQETKVLTVVNVCAERYDIFEYDTGNKIVVTYQKDHNDYLESKRTITQSTNTEDKHFECCFVTNLTGKTIDHITPNESKSS